MAGTKTQTIGNQIAFQDDSWTAGLSGAEEDEDVRNVRLALVCETYNMSDFDKQYEDDPYPVVMECGVIVTPDDLSEKFRKDVESSMEYADIVDVYGYSGGVPVTDVLEGITSRAKSDVDNEVRTQKHATFGHEIKIRHFRDEDDALQYAEDVYKENANALFSLIGFTLDRPINRAGWTGWDLIKQQATGEEMRW